MPTLLVSASDLAFAEDMRGARPLNWDTASKVLLAALSALAGWLRLRPRGRGRREQLKQDLELLNSLPDDSTSRDALRAHIDSAVQRLVEDEDERKRNSAGIALAIALLALAGWLMYVGASNGRWWWWLFVLGVFLGATGAVGLGQDAVPRKRDAKGRAIG